MRKHVGVVTAQAFFRRPAKLVGLVVEAVNTALGDDLKF
jgi:hypothetical protein